MSHPTQVFLSNPAALRVEFRVDDHQLRLWWSPLAGKSTDARDRNYSSRDAHLQVFQSISLPGCDLGSFRHCDYDPYACILRFEHQTLHLALPIDLPAVLLRAEKPQVVAFKTERFATALEETAGRFSVVCREPRHSFEMAACLAPGLGRFVHCHFHADGQPYFASAHLAAGQPMAIGVGLSDGGTSDHLSALAGAGPLALGRKVNEVLAIHEATGHIVSPQHPELEAMRRTVIRGLHSMIDESGAFRASLKEIYYLIWVRDGGFSFSYQAAAGWPHKLPEFCRFLLDNPLVVRDPGLPQTRMFGQLINRDLGKLEEDGLYYVVWTLFSQWTQNGHLDFVTGQDWELVEEALAWVEAVAWDGTRGLFGEYTSDETPAYGSRDMGWDYAIAQPTGSDYCIRYEGQPVTRNYDVYFNTCMHSAYVMLAAMRGNAACYLEKARRLWTELEKLLNNRTDGVPCYGELLLENARRTQAPYWGPECGASCCVWGLTMPNFAPLADWDSVRAATLDAIIAKPDMHFINGICSAMAAVDPWCYEEAKLLALHHRLALETNTPGRFLPMGGAMPEKFNAPQGNIYHDIRPQGFAMGAWLAAWASLGLRRLPHGLALRPTQAFDRIESYFWRGMSLTFRFGPATRNLAMEIDGERIEGTLQVPQQLLRDGSLIQLVESESDQPLWLRSSVQLDSVSCGSDEVIYRLAAHGLSEIVFAATPKGFLIAEADGSSIPCASVSADGLFKIQFSHFGPAVLRVS